MLEKLGQLIPKEDMLQLLEKAKINHKEEIDKWTNEYEGRDLSSINKRRFPFARSDRFDRYFQSKNDGFKKENHLKMVGSNLGR